MRKKEKLVHGAGVNDADYSVAEVIRFTDEGGNRVQKLVWICPFYSKWESMLRRCCSVKTKQKNPTYIDCSVCEEWLTFSEFRQWMKSQDYVNKHLDKDILCQGNKLYSPATCVFVDVKVNSFVIESNAIRGKYMIGVSWHKTSGKFRSYCKDGSGKQKHLGLFNTEIEAHKAWLRYKQEVALKLADEQTDPRVAKALIDRYENYVAQEKEIA